MNTNEPIQEYQILQSPSPAEIEGLVNAKIREGWQPWGVLLYNDMLYVQVVVKKNADTVCGIDSEAIGFDRDK